MIGQSLSNTNETCYSIQIAKICNLNEAQLFLTEDMEGASSQWLPGLQEHHQQLHGEDMDVYTWI